ncbi:2-hydroxyacid dehydrogenase [Paracoccus laeviglucosivorans]|uniref:Lactate dehydrogenase n=1 Tax=Paracoccus laeviglucosivorans TaxID=1197861 RepID=A0A521E8J0_9RHOB|nr:D-glycerate dehydrogenase [Paracoccus laeviglucosivorans]SMO80276.1 Lactate dehydrogenase [Paracoccus laeviglucosivorans]
MLLIATPLPAAVGTRALQEFSAAAAPENMTQLVAPEGTRAVLLSSRQRVDAAAVAALPASIGLIATCSVGFDHIDLAACAARGIKVTNTPDVLTDATAEIAMLLILAAARRAREYGQIMDQGWGKAFALNQMLGMQLSGKVLGIVGMGRIGGAVAYRAQAFGMTILYHNRNRLPQDAECGTYCADLDDLLARADVVSLNLPGAGNQPLMTAAQFARMKPGAIFVNTARGGLVDDDALLAALASGHLGGAGLDVFRGEPAFDRRYLDQPRAFLTPHMGSATLDTREAMGHRALDNVAAFLAGRTPADLVTRAA